MKTLHTVQTVNNVGDPYDELAVAVIEQAIDDYRRLGRKLPVLSSSLEKRRIEDEMKSIVRFFLSEWYRLLSSGENGPHILELLNEEVFGND